MAERIKTGLVVCLVVIASLVAVLLVIACISIVMVYTGIYPCSVPGNVTSWCG